LTNTGTRRPNGFHDTPGADKAINVHFHERSGSRRWCWTQSAQLVAAKEDLVLLLVSIDPREPFPNMARKAGEILNTGLLACLFVAEPGELPHGPEPSFTETGPLATASRTDLTVADHTAKDTLRDSEITAGSVASRARNERWLASVFYVQVGEAVVRKLLAIGPELEHPRDDASSEPD